MDAPQKARWATAVLFAVDGVGFGVWAAHIPVFKANLHLSSTSLSWVLLALVVGSILTMPLAAALVLYAMVRSMVVTMVQGGVVWRGTFYPLRELRRESGRLR